MVYIGKCRPRVLLLTLFAFATLYFTKLTIHMQTFKKPSLTTGFSYFTDEEINRLEDGFEDQVHPRLLQWIRTQWILPPSAAPLNLSNPERKDFSQRGQSIIVDEILQQKTNGFFVECGAYDGEHLSNSLFFERQRNWSGLLIEADTTYFRRIKARNRKAFSINACLSSKQSSAKAQFGIGHFNALKDEKLPSLKFRRYITVQCFTLYSLMKALDRTKIDFFSLDVEGAEVGVLNTIPFSQLDIDILLVEYHSYGGTENDSEIRFKAIDSLIKPKGYILIKKTKLDLLYRKVTNA